MTGDPDMMAKDHREINGDIFADEAPTKQPSVREVVIALLIGAVIGWVMFAMTPPQHVPDTANYVSATG